MNLKDGIKKCLKISNSEIERLIKQGGISIFDVFGEFKWTKANDSNMTIKNRIAVRIGPEWRKNEFSLISPEEEPELRRLDSLDLIINGEPEEKLIWI